MSRTGGHNLPPWIKSHSRLSERLGSLPGDRCTQGCVHTLDPGSDRCCTLKVYSIAACMMSATDLLAPGTKLE